MDREIDDHRAHIPHRILCALGEFQPFLPIDASADDLLPNARFGGNLKVSPFDHSESGSDQQT